MCWVVRVQWGVRVWCLKLTKHCTCYSLSGIAVHDAVDNTLPHCVKWWHFMSACAFTVFVFFNVLPSHAVSLLPSHSSPTAPFSLSLSTSLQQVYACVCLPAAWPLLLHSMVWVGVVGEYMCACVQAYDCIVCVLIWITSSFFPVQVAS